METLTKQDPESFIGQHASKLPTPALVLSLPLLQENIRRLHDDVSQLGIAFRPHVKTLKSLEVTKMMLGGGRHRKIAASTLPEIIGAIPLAVNGELDECLYSLPVYPGILPRLVEVSRFMTITLMIDNEQHISVLEAHRESNPLTSPPWGVYIKIDVGSSRAGITTQSHRLRLLVQLADKSPAVKILGFYCHAGHSYNCRVPEDAEAVLHAEVDGALKGASLLPPDRPLVISIGATPTAHVIRKLRIAMPPNVTFELHAGNFPANDLQQVSTGLVTESQQAIRICAEVCSLYPERNEALVNVGVIALSRETSAFPGFGIVCGKPQWSVVRQSQEHGILGKIDATVALAGESATSATEDFGVGDVVFLYCQHACITAAAFNTYYVVDAQDIVRQCWHPWKGW